MTLTATIIGAQAAVQALFDDTDIAETVTIVRDPQLAADDILDEVTGALLPAVGDTTTVYTGPALIAPASTRTEPAIEGAAGTYPDAYQLRLPATAAPLRIGDTLTVTGSPDGALVGRVFTVDAVLSTGRMVTRRASLHATVPGPRR